jgi:hypothetical protein
VTDRQAKFILFAALLLQILGFAGLLMWDFSNPLSSAAFWVVIGAGVVEVALAIRAKRLRGAANG